MQRDLKLAVAGQNRDPRDGRTGRVHDQRAERRRLQDRPGGRIVREDGHAVRPVRQPVADQRPDARRIRGAGADHVAVGEQRQRRVGLHRPGEEQLIDVRDPVRVRGAESDAGLSFPCKGASTVAVPAAAVVASPSSVMVTLSVSVTPGVV